MTTLITGAAGFIGMHLSDRLLCQGEMIVGIDNLNEYYGTKLKNDRIAKLTSQYNGAFNFIKVDFSDQRALEDSIRDYSFDRIVHLGAQAGVRYSIENPSAYARSNLVGHLNMLELARARAVDCMIYASSSSVYGANKRTPFSVEDRADNPVSLYAATKRADELMSEAYAHLYQIPLIGLRFFTVYGPWGRPDMAMWTFTRKIFAAEPIQVFNFGAMRRDFTYIDDVVSGIVKCLDNLGDFPRAGEEQSLHRLYNLGNRRPEDLLHMIHLLEQACGRKAKLELLPMQKGDVPETFADISSAEQELGFAPATSIEEGIPRFVQWYMQYHRIDS